MSCPECNCGMYSHRKSDSSKSIAPALKFFKKQDLEEQIQKLKSELEMIKVEREDLVKIIKRLEDENIELKNNLSNVKLYSWKKPLRELEKLKAELKAEREVVDFYANTKHWQEMELEDCNDDYEKLDKNRPRLTGGKRAREQQSKRLK